uniref:Uncharacterized protein n=1 Tax=Ralstonia syzygii R24 TaxID=907261 RepID=G3A058_9RALS|nr:hypothetical protein RALSY_10525 [Ralstonia syzygii R24]
MEGIVQLRLADRELRSGYNRETVGAAGLSRLADRELRSGYNKLSSVAPMVT